MDGHRSIYVYVLPGGDKVGQNINVSYCCVSCTAYTVDSCFKADVYIPLFSERAVCCAYDWIFAVRNIQGLHNRKRQNGVYVFRVCLYGFGGDAVYYVLSRAFGTALFTGVCVALASLVSDLGAYLRLLTIYFAEYAGFL